MKNVWFDMADVSLSNPKLTATQSKLIAQRIRQFGIQRILYGTDTAVDPVLPRREG